MENQGVAYRKSENSERIRLIFELDRDIDVTMLCEKFEAVRPLFLELSCKRPDILTDFRVYSFFFLSTQKRSGHQMKID